MPYVKKIKSKSGEALRIYLKSKHFTSHRKRAETIRDNPLFQKECAQMLKKHPPIIDDNLLRHLETKEGQVIYFQHKKTWKDFFDKWGINYVLNDLPSVKTGVVLGRDANDQPTLTIISKEATRQDVEAHIPLLMDIARATYGSPPVTQGIKRGKWAQRNHEIRNKFKALQKTKTKSKDIFSQLARQYNVAEITIQRIVYGKKQ